MEWNPGHGGMMTHSHACMLHSDYSLLTCYVANGPQILRCIRHSLINKIDVNLIKPSSRKQRWHDTSNMNRAYAAAFAAYLLVLLVAPIACGPAAKRRPPSPPKRSKPPPVPFPYPPAILLNDTTVPPPSPVQQQPLDIPSLIAFADKQLTQTIRVRNAALCKLA